MPNMNRLHQASTKSNTTTTTKQKERHIVTWTQQEDDILREQIGIHGTDNWGIIAAKFKDKTTRQCRRRWFTYLNSDFKKGGWSPEEDMILCEAQRIFGNRWTEIAKVVSGRTDNAVKNRFSTLCKKRAKHDALSKENSLCINSNNKRCLVPNAAITNGTSDSAPPLKKTRTHITETTQSHNLERRLHRESGTTGTQQLRYPFALLVQNSHNVDALPVQPHVSNTSSASNDVGSSKVQGTFLRRDDPKITALMQQAELLTSLAAKVNTETTDQSLENAWKELQNFLNRANEGELHGNKISHDFPLEDLKGLVDDLKSSNMASMLYWRQPNLYESPGSSEYSTGSTLQSHTTCEKTEQPQAEVCSLNQEAAGLPQEIMFSGNGDGGCEDDFSATSVIGDGPRSIHTDVKNEGGSCINRYCTSTYVTQVANLAPCGEIENGITTTMSNTDFSSPIQVTPLFRTFAAGIPTPKFSESERHFLLKTLGMASPSPSPSTNPIPNTPQPPPCRRALLHSL